MRILVLNYEYPPVGGGAGSFSQDLVTELVHRKNKILVLTSHAKGLSFMEVDTNLIVLRLPVFRINKSKSNYLQMFIYVKMSLLILPLIKLFFNPEFVHSHFVLPTGLIASFPKPILYISMLGYDMYLMK